MSEPLIVKYRPNSFDEMIGNSDVLPPLIRVLKTNTCPHAFLFTGPSGTGKTTLARIIATELKSEVIEIDAASNNGIDAIRELIDSGQNMPFRGETKFYIIDECFESNTLVNTSKGFVKISDINIGDEVIGALGINKVNNIFKNSVPLTHIVQLRFNNGCSIICSENHAFLTECGWFRASELSDGAIFKTIFSPPVSVNLQRLWDNIFSYRTGSDSLREVQTKKTTKNLSCVWRNLFYKNINLFLGMWDKTSFKKTFGSTFAGTSNSYKNGNSKICQIRKRIGSGSKIFGKNERKQSYDAARNYSQSCSNKNSKRNTKTQKSVARWQWSWAIQATKDFIRHYWRRNGIRRTYEEFAERVKLRLLLQNRLSFAGIQTSNRNRWRHPSLCTTTTIRSKKGSMLNELRLDSITRLKQSYIEELRTSNRTYCIGTRECMTLYDLEIDHHPSYSVENIIVHNCHGLSKPAFNALLKTLEEPPPHLYLALCTTELGKILETIRTRCYHVSLRRVSDKDMGDLIDAVCACEDWTVDNNVVSAVIEAATGQPRKALSLLQACYDAPTRDEAKRIISLVDTSEPLMDVLKTLMQGKRSWEAIQPMLARIDDDEFNDDTLIGAGRYIMAGMLRENSTAKARGLWTMLEALVYPTSSFDKKAVFIAAVGRMIWS